MGGTNITCQRDQMKGELINSSDRNVLDIKLKLVKNPFAKINQRLKKMDDMNGGSEGQRQRQRE